MGACLGTSKDPDNIFKVTNINDDQRLVQKGVMEVTPTELIYTDSKTKENWRWPLKYLRKYGCDGDVFSFEAGRKCPGGEGLYAFSARRASLLFDTVAKNINHGNLQPPPGELSPFPSDAPRPDPSILSFSRRHSSTQSPTHEQPNYANMDPSGRPLVENGAVGLSDSEAPKPDSPPTVYAEPMKFLYREVVFEKPPEDHPVPLSDTQQNTSYTQIDFEQTERFNRDRKHGPLPETTVTTSLPRTSTSSIGVSSGSRGEKKGGRRRMQTYSAGGTQRSPSESGSYSSQSSLTESSRDVRSPGQVANGGVPLARSSVTDQSLLPTSSMYQNVMVGGAGGVVQQPNYQNVHVGGGSVNQVFESVQQPNYQNVSLPTQNGRSNVNGVIVGGDPRGQYADLQLSNGSSSRMRTTSSTSYMQLDFARHDMSSHSSVVPQPSAGGPSSGHKDKAQTPTQLVTPVLEISTSNGHFKENSPSLALPPTTKPPLVDETKVAYGMLDFPVMENLSKLSREREQEKKQEQDERERTLATASHSKKKK